MDSDDSVIALGDSYLRSEISFDPWLPLSLII